MEGRFVDEVMVGLDGIIEGYNERRELYLEIRRFVRGLIWLFCC